MVRSERVIGKGEAATAAARAALDAGARAAGGRRRVVFVLCDGDLGDSARGCARSCERSRAGEADLAVAAFATRVGGGFGLALGFARWAIRRRCGLLDAGADLRPARADAAGAARDVLPFAHGFGMEIGMTIDAVRAGHRVIEIELDLEHRASGRTPAGFAHRARQLVDFVRAYLARRQARMARR